MLEWLLDAFREVALGGLEILHRPTVARVLTKSPQKRPVYNPAGPAVS